MPRAFRNPYPLADGTPSPGVTTVLGILGKPFLIKWANNLGLRGINSEEFTNKQKRIGTLIHDAIHRDLQGQAVSFAAGDNPDYTASELARGKMGFDAYLAWKNKHEIKPILLEKALVSERCRYGGTIDFYGQVDGKLTLLDFTAGKAIYSEKQTQVIAYRALCAENNYPVEDCRVVRFPRDIDEGVEAEDKPVDKIGDRWGLFLLCLEIYPLLKKVG